MNSMNSSKAADVEQREEIEKFHETVVDIKVNVSFMIAGKIVKYEGISKMEVEENGAGVFWYNKRKANDSFDRVLKDTKIAVSDSEKEEEKKHERRLNGVLECIRLYPGEKRFYDAIINDILCADQVEFYEFIQYWKMEDMFPNLTPRRRIQTGK